MDIKDYVGEYTRKKKYHGLSYSADFVHNILNSDKDYAFTNQEFYENSEYLAYNIRSCVKGYQRDKKAAIEIYKHFLDFLHAKGVDEDVKFPPIDISNSFERLMFIAKYLQDPRHNIADLSDLLWVSEVTIRADIRKLLGEDEDPIQICGKKFIIDDVERRRGLVRFSSTAHPIFLTHNLSQVLVTLKGLKAMSQNPLYAMYAKMAAADIWEQLSDYAKTRIHFVLSELLPEDLTWYESLNKDNGISFYTEHRCSEGNNILDCMKNDKIFFVEYSAPDGICIYQQCRYIPHTYDCISIDVESASGWVRLELDKVIRTAYTAEGLI